MLKKLSEMLAAKEPTEEYCAAVMRALNIPECKVLPFFGTFLRDLSLIFSNLPSLVVLPTEDDKTIEVRQKTA